MEKYTQRARYRAITLEFIRCDRIHFAALSLSFWPFAERTSPKTLGRSRRLRSAPIEDVFNERLVRPRAW